MEVTEIHYSITDLISGNFRVTKREFLGKSKSIYTCQKYYGFKTIEDAQIFVKKKQIQDELRKEKLTNKEK